MLLIIIVFPIINFKEQPPPSKHNSRRHVVRTRIYCNYFDRGGLISDIDLHLLLALLPNEHILKKVIINIEKKTCSRALHHILKAIRNPFSSEVHRHGQIVVTLDINKQIMSPRKCYFVIF